MSVQQSWNRVFQTQARSVHFCGECGSILTIPSDSDVVVCDICHATTPMSRLRPLPFPFSTPLLCTHPHAVCLSVRVFVRVQDSRASRW